MMHKKFGQILKNWKFFNFDQSRIDRIPIESGRKTWLKMKGISIGRKTHSINRNSRTLNFWKTVEDYAENMSF